MSSLDASPSAFYTRSNKTVLGYCMIVGLAVVLYGLDTGEITGFLAMKRFVEDFGYFDPGLHSYNISAKNQTLLYGTMLSFACVAAAISGPLGARFGRRFGLGLCAITSIIGPAIQTGATSWSVVIVGRCFTGLGMGFAANFVIPYWTETTPATLRGLVVVMYQGIINVAGFIGACINQGTHSLDTRWAYRAPLLVQLAPPIILLPFLFWIPDTPRWYISQGHIDKGLAAMIRIRGPTYSEEEIKQEIQEISAFIEIEKELEGSSSYLDCFRGTNLRRTLLTIGSTMCQEFSGISFISGYGTYFFQISGIKNAFTITMITGICGIAGSASAFVLIKYLGRRHILLGGSAICGISMLIFAIIGVVAASSQAAARCLVAFVCLFIFSYSATWGPVSQVLLGELSSTQHRSKTVAIATSAGWICDILIICGMPYLLSPDYANLGPKVGFIFGGCEIVIFLWTIFFLPETKDRSLEEIDELFLNNVPALKFRSYITTSKVGGLTAEKALERMDQK